MASKFKIDTEGSGIDYGLDTGQKKKWTRDNRDNKYFKEIQVKNLSKYVDDGTIYVWDFDGVIWKECSKVEDSYIIVKNISTGEEKEHDNITAFKGRVKKGYAANSWLGLENVKREASGDEPLSLEDFEITKHKRLKNGCDLNTVKENVQGYIDDVKRQWDIKKVLLCHGRGVVFRDKLPLPTPYKGIRDPQDRPLLLEDACKWVIEELNGEMAPEGFECDDLCEWYANLGWKSYKATGKFSYVLLAEDKDGWSNPKMYITYTREGNLFKLPQAILIEDSSTNVGTLELVQQQSGTKMVGTSLKWLIAQAFLIGDACDGYHPYLKLPKHYKDSIKYGQTQAYKDFVNLNTQADVLQKAVDLFAEWFPNGVAYTDCHGVDQDFSTLEYMEVMFSVAYMTRSAEDRLRSQTLLDYFKVDYSKLVDNNKPKQLKLADTDTIMSNLSDISNLLDIVMSNLSNTKGNKPELIKRLEDGCDELNKLKTLLRGCYE